VDSQPPDTRTPAPVRREGGRSARVCAAVHQAVADLVTENGADELTIPAVAARAGVNPTSVYRRWGDMKGLLADVATTRLTPHDPPPDTGSLRGDLLRWAEQTRATITTPEVRALLRCAVSQALTTPGPTPRMAAREQQLATILAHAEERDEPRPTLHQVLDHLLAPLYFRVMLSLGPVEPEDARRLVEDLLHHYAGGCAPSAGRPPAGRTEAGRTEAGRTEA
jgi:AcrR family transcriptional regulator